MQGQLVLTGKSPRFADIDLDRMLELVNPATRIDAQDLAALGVDSCLRPGADGAVAALVCSDEVVQRALMLQLQAQANRSEFAWQELSDREFVDAIAEPWKSR